MELELNLQCNYTKDIINNLKKILNAVKGYQREKKDQKEVDNKLLSDHIIGI